MDRQVDDDDGDGKTREHLEPKSATKRNKTEDNSSREKLTDAMMAFINFKTSKAAADAEKNKVDQLNEQLKMYMGFLSNSSLTPAMRINYESMINNIQIQIMKHMDSTFEPLRRSPRGTPTKTRADQVSRARAQSSSQSPIAPMSSRMTQEELQDYGVLGRGDGGGHGGV